MFKGYMQLGDVELINDARFKAYVEKHTNNITVKCDAPDLHVALGDSPYTSPSVDAAPWYKASRPATDRFYGVRSIDVVGLWDGTRSTSVTELIGDGAVQSLPRDASGEARVKVLLAAADDEALADGWAWFKEAVAGDNCDDATLGCVGHTMRVFTAQPKTLTEYVTFGRNFYGVELLDGPKIIKQYASKNASMMEVDLIFSIGRPWPMTDLTTIDMLDMDLAVNHTDVPGEDCSAVSQVYDNFITDPFYTDIALPPRAPSILPPNVLDISSWRRMEASLPAAMTERPGRVIPVIRIFSGAAGAQFVRVRFYRADVVGHTGCDYDGEFLVSYVPPNSVMTLDGIRREVSVTLPDTRVVPAGHLLFGTDGRPFRWPSLGCHENYVVTVDMMPGQPDISVYIDAAVRE